MTYEVGQRVYWRGLFGQLCGGFIKDGPHVVGDKELERFDRLEHDTPYWLVLPDTCLYAIWLQGPFHVLPDTLKVAS